MQPMAPMRQLVWPGLLSTATTADNSVCLFTLQYKVKDMAEADFGRLEIEMAEAEMPGLMSCR